MLLAHASAQVQSLRVAVFTDQLQNIKQHLNDNNCAPLEAHRYRENQMVMEYLLVCNTLLDLLPNLTLELIDYPVALRAVNAVANGEADITGFGVWAGESQQVGIIRSIALLQAGEFHKGLFVTGQTLETLNGNLSNGMGIDLKSLVGVSNKNWTYDWALLKCGLADVVHVDRYEQMFQLLERERADVLPLAFGKTSVESRKEFGISLYPIPGYKMAIPDSSHYLVSSNLSYGFSLIKAINKRLIHMRESGSLMEHYFAVGAVNPAVRAWQSICEFDQYVRPAS